MKVSTRNFLAAFTAVCVFAFAGVANATPIKWTLSGATLSDSSTLTGSFYYDAASNTYTNWSLAVSGGSLSAFVYDPSASSLIGLSSATELLVVKNDYSRYLNLNFVSALSAAGGTVALELTRAASNIFDGSWECSNCGTIRLLTSGSVSAAEVPEPTSIALLSAALLGLGLSARRRTQA